MTEIPDVMAADGENNLREQAAEYHEKLIEAAVEVGEGQGQGQGQGQDSQWLTCSPSHLLPLSPTHLLSCSPSHLLTCLPTIPRQVDEDLLMAYLEGEMPSEADLKRCIRTGTIRGDFVPVLTGTAFKNKGVQPLLDAVIDYMPSPLDVDAIKGRST